MDSSLNSIIEENLNILKSRGATKWTGSKYEAVKTSSRTVIGDFGEHTLVDLFNSLGLVAKIVNKGRGDFDILLLNPLSGKSIKIEVKTATEDVNRNFQFNGIKKGIDYDCVFCLGIAPSEMFFGIFPRELCEEKLTTNMSKGVTGSYKMTASLRHSVWGLVPLTRGALKKEIYKYV